MTTIATTIATALTNLQVRGAVVRVTDFLKPLTSDYSRMYSVRGILTEQLSYTNEQADEVIRYIAAHGFAYCLDHQIAVRDESGIEIRPDRDVCIWNPDQLYSRMRCVSIT